MARGEQGWNDAIGAQWVPLHAEIVSEVLVVYKAAMITSRERKNGINPLAARQVDALNADQGALFGLAPPIVLPPAIVSAGSSRELFERWWKAYPAHRRLEKIRTWVIWGRIEPKFTAPMVEAMIALLHRQKQHPDWIKEGGSFVPYPSRYLARGRWMDECVRMASVPSGDVDNAFALAAWLASKKQRMLE